ncbi:YoaK family protein [Pseudarthrobacter sp. PvP090]|uniref:YoaK family protein n=1 Tax=Pseudarthrobacter sp. PvP090 TaxID=3156393 RepID=UPI00339B3695
MLNRLKSSGPGRLHLILMLVLTFSTGVIDAVGYLGLDRVFTGNMTGNVVILGMAFVGADELPVLGPAIALAGFVVGAVIAGRILRPEASGWSRRTTALLTAVGLVMAAVAAVLFVVPPHAGSPITLIITAALALAMGLQAATARHLSVKDVTTVVVTSTLTGLAADSRLGGGTGAHWGRRLGAVVLILVGAAAGAALLQVHVGLGVLLTALLSLGVAVTGGIARRRTSSPAAPATSTTPPTPPRRVPA